MQNEQHALIDNHAFSGLLVLLYQSISSANWQPFLQQVMAITCSNKAFVSLKNISNDSPLFLNIAIDFEYPPEAVIAYQQRPFDDPLFEVVRYLPEGEIIEPSKVIDINSYRDTEFYQVVLGPLKSHHALGLVVIRDGTHDASFVINRGPEDPPYSGHELHLMALLKPHVQQAMRLFILFQGIGRQNDMLKAVLEQTDKALLVLDADCRIQLANQQANKLLNTLPYWHNLANSFVLKNKAEQQQFRQLLADCLHDHVSERDKFYLQLGAADVSVYLTLAPLHWLTLDNSADNLCLLTISHQQHLSWHGIQMEYSLTKRELELVQALYNGSKLTELTEQMAISYNTLRRHLQAIFKKCRINSQSELMLLLSRFN